MVCSCTTKGCIVVQLECVTTRLSRPADCSQQSYRLGSAALLSLVVTLSITKKNLLSFQDKPNTKLASTPKRRLISRPTLNVGSSEPER